MLVGIHQPHYLPWLRYLEKIDRSDVFIVLDDVQYEKNGFQNRNKIKTAQGWSYLTVPILKPTQRPICEIEIDNRTNWREKHARSIELSYRKAPFFEQIWPGLSELYAREWTRLAPLNRAMLELYLQQAGIDTRLVYSSEMVTVGQSTERLAELCRLVGGDTYLSGAYAVEAYLDPEILRAAGIRLAFQSWTAPVYPQLYPQAGFIPDLAIIDLLFNVGPDAGKVLRGSGGITYPELG